MGSEVSKQSIFLTDTFLQNPGIESLLVRSLARSVFESPTCVSKDGSTEKRGEGEKKRFLTCSFVCLRCGIVETVQRRIHEI